MKFSFNIFKKSKKTNIELAMEGDKEAFCYLIKENTDSLYRVAKGILKKEEDVEDAISASILNAYKNIIKLKNTDYFKTWLIRILINECNYIIKKNKNVNYIEDYTSISISGYKDSYKNFDLSDALEKLDENLKQVVILYYYEDMKQIEIAKVLDVNETTVRTRLFRAKNKLKELLEYEEKIVNL